MTGIDRRGDTPMGPPWSVDVLADLHAGVLDPDVARRLWPQVRRDPEASAVLDALDATIGELGGLAAAPPPLMPAHLAARLDAAIAAEAAAAFPAPRQPMPTQFPLRPVGPPPAPVVDLARARTRRNRTVGWVTGALVAAAAVAVAVIAIPRGGSDLTGGAAAAPPRRQQLTTGQLDSAVVASAVGRNDYGPLTDPTRRSACLAANDDHQTPIGAMQVVLNGEQGVLFVLTTGTLAQFRVLVVGDACAADTPDQLADVVVGGPQAPTR